MGEYEELCENMGLSPGSEDDYELLTDMLVNGKRATRKADNSEDRDSADLIFVTYQEAREWSKANNGHPFSRTADGDGFTPVGSKLAKPVDRSRSNKGDSLGQGSIDQYVIRAFLKGESAPGTGWLPGTWTNSFDEGPADLDYIMEKRFFLPRLSVLAPEIANWAKNGRFVTYNLPRLMSSKHHQAQSSAQLRELLDLLEGKLVRLKRWYATQAAAGGEIKTYEFLPSPFQASGKIHEHERQHGKTPKELYFWQGTVEILRQELARRGSSFTERAPV